MLDSVDPYYLAIIDQSTNQAIGTFALMRIDSKNRVIEVGWVLFSPKLQKHDKQRRLTTCLCPIFLRT